MRRLHFWISMLIVSALLLAALGCARPALAAEDAVVRGILFYSPTCPHCHQVMDEVIPPLRESYGEQLVIVEVDTTSPEGGALWQATVTRYNPPLVGVPTLIMGEQMLVGSRQIPEQLPALIEAYLADGGIAWPDLPGIENVVEEGAAETSEPAGFWAQLRERYTRDLAGNILATVVLVGLLVSMASVVQSRAWQSTFSARVGALGVLVPLAVGMVAALYLSYVETTGNEAVCGPVGDCNTVQQSEFAVLFGFLPVAVLGVLGYLAILVAYVGANWLEGVSANIARAAVFTMSLFGLLFSTFLTFLEPFVIGATCAWCLASAVCMALITLATAGPGWEALRSLGRQLGVVNAAPQQE